MERHNETLDPDDWDELRRTGHRMMDDMFDYLAAVRERPVWKPIPPVTRTALSARLPVDPSPIDSVYDEFRTHVLPYPTGNIHPRFWGWVMGTGTPVAMLADMLASGMNAWVGGFDDSSTLVEEQVLRWLSEMLGYDAGASGVLTSGCTVANIIGLSVARHAMAGFDVRARGIRGGETPLVLYGSTETHSWATKAVELLGFGHQSLRRIPVDSRHRMDVEALSGVIAADRARGNVPICVIGTAGTVNIGAVDDLRSIAAVCRRERLWFHIDGAFGALAALSPKFRNKVPGLELADSLAFDLHKWMYMPFEAGCVLVRDGDLHRQAFELAPTYLGAHARGVAPLGPLFAARGIDLARSFKALKVWMSLKVHGVSKFGRLIEQNIEQAHALERIIQAEARLELLAPVELNVVCFRFNPGNVDDRRLDAINEEILILLQESGVAVPSGTRLSGRFAIRVAITNHRSRQEDFDLLVREVQRLGAALMSPKGPVS
ncbi:MAG TPA: pyridoxal-dependent decarboxylase [Thermoanaerobaculia bacterium]|nr:pyridoxal-dependent decarboxylase [Thermoanaerobaculia bacterium]